MPGGQYYLPPPRPGLLLVGSQVWPSLDGVPLLPPSDLRSHSTYPWPGLPCFGYICPPPTPRTRIPSPNIPSQPSLSTSGLRDLSRKFFLTSNSSLTCCKMEFHFLSVLQSEDKNPRGKSAKQQQRASSQCWCWAGIRIVGYLQVPKGGSRQEGPEGKQGHSSQPLPSLSPGGGAEAPTCAMAPPPTPGGRQEPC